MLIRFSLLLIFGAIASFLLAIVLDQLAISAIAGQVSQLGAMVLLCAFLLILIAGSGQISKLFIASVYGYFSTRQRMERKLLFYINKHNRLNQLFLLKKARLLYFGQQQRKRLLKKDGRKSVPS